MRIVVIRAGLAGLVAAWGLQREGYDVAVYEQPQNTSLFDCEPVNFDWRLFAEFI